MERSEKRVLTPMITSTHKEDGSGLHIDVDLAGAPKDSIELEMGKEGLCIQAEADDFRYESCFRLAHTVRAEEARAHFESGLLRIDVPFENTLGGHKVTIQ